jgi:hypothetical protein
MISFDAQRAFHNLRLVRLGIWSSTATITQLAFISCKSALHTHSVQCSHGVSRVSIPADILRAVIVYTLQSRLKCFFFPTSEPYQVLTMYRFLRCCQARARGRRTIFQEYILRCTYWKVTLNVPSVLTFCCPLCHHLSVRMLRRTHSHWHQKGMPRHVLRY